MINVSSVLVVLALAAAAPEADPQRGTKPAEATGQRVEPPCAGPACPVPVPFPSTKATTDATPGTPASTDLIVSPCPPPSGSSIPASNGNEAGTSSGHCAKPMGLGPPIDVKH